MNDPVNMSAFLTAWWRSPSRRRGAGLALVCFLATLGTWAGAVATLTGQRLESAALAGSRIGSHIVNDHARMLLHVVSMPAAIALVVVILLVGLVRGSRRRGWWAAGTVVAINASTQILKHWVLWRPDYGISLRPDGANTLPSGHTASAVVSAAAALSSGADPASGVIGAGVVAGAGAALSVVAGAAGAPADAGVLAAIGATVGVEGRAVGSPASAAETGEGSAAPVLRSTAAEEATWAACGAPPRPVGSAVRAAWPVACSSVSGTA